MKFKFQQSVHITSDTDTVWNAVNSARFEKDYLPEVKRSQSGRKITPTSIDGYTTSWHRTEELDIALTRKDLNVKIQSVQIALAPTAHGTRSTITVAYEKSVEKHFVKAHLAIRRLFAHKLQVLKSDLATEEPCLVFQA